MAFIVSAAAAAVVAGGGLLGKVVWRAEAARQDGGREDRASEPVSAESLDAGDEVSAPRAQDQPSGRVNVLVELTEAPTTQVYAETLEKSGLPRASAEAAANRAAQAQLRVVEQQQAAVATALASRFRATEVYRTQRVINGIVVAADAAQVEAMRQTPGVQGVHIMIPESLSNSSSVPFLGVQQLWDSSFSPRPNLTGTGIRIGIIDTGVDYIHANFGGTGAASDYQNNNRTTNADGYFPTAKVIGGRDFAGDRYNADAATTADPNDTSTPQPDDDPMDCNSHGTHVAGTAAGLGVKTDNTPYTGPYGNATPFASLKIGPGTAPGASIVALRVFGCVGTTNLTLQAIDYAVDPNGDGNFSDRLDVINMSLGSGYGSAFNPSEVAATNASLVGVMVVTSAGNSGDSYFIHGAPGSSPRALSVAASVDPGAGTGGSLRVNSPPALAGEKPAATVNYGPPPNGQTADVVLVNDNATNAQPNPSPSPTPIASPSGTTTDACQPLVNAAQVAGKIAIADRGLCTAKTKTYNAQNAGAIGLIIVNNSATDIAPPGFADDPNITAPITIPTLVVTQQDGNAIKTELAANRPVNVTFRAGTPADTVASFSSRGPRRGELPLRLKPDISAPGLSITSSFTGIVQSGGTAGNVAIQAGSPTLTISGTSMACPHLAGIMALLRQLHPDWSIEELKASAMNGAVHDLYVGANNSGPRYGLTRIGAGRVDPPNSATNTAVAYDANDPGVVSVSAFDNEVVGTATRTRTIRVVNKGTSDLTYTLGIDTVNDAPGVAFSLPGGTSLTVPAGQAVTFDVQLSATADQMDHVRDPTVASIQTTSNFPRHYLTEEGAYVTFRQGDALRMRVPVYVAPRPASVMRATDVVITEGATSGQTALALDGQDVCTGTRSPSDCAGSFPTDVVSLVTPFELQFSDPADPGVLPSGDLRYAGVSYDGTNVNFGVSTYGDWTWPRDTEFDIYIDANEDGVFEKVLFNTALTSGGFGTDVYVTALQSLVPAGGASAQSFINGVTAGTRDTAIYNNNVMFLPVPAANILSGGDTSFRWALAVFDSAGNADYVGMNPNGTPNNPRTFNYAAPGVSFPQSFSTPNNSGILFADLDGRTIPVSFNRTNLNNNGSLGALLLHHHNARGTRAEIVTVQGQSQTTTDIGVGVTVNNPNPPLNSNVNITVTASNVSANNATNVRVLDKLPSGLQFVSATPSVGSYDPNTGVWTIGALNAGQTATLQIVATVRTTDAITDTATFAGADQLDTNSSNDQASAAVSAPRTADLGVTLSAHLPTVNPGDALTYTVTVTNFGGDTANNIAVNMSFVPPVPNIISASASNGVFNTGTRVWNIGGLGAGHAATLTVTVRVPTVCGNLTATAAVTSADTADPNSVNNSASLATPIGPEATVQFAQASYSVQEDSTAVNVVVTRSGNGSVPLSVNYATADGSASSHSDYNSASGRLDFAAGEMSKTITVLINEDSYSENTESFTVTLGATSGCEIAVGSQGSTTVQITDDSPEQTTNPIDDDENFVRQHYHDFLNREPDAPGLAFWVNGIKACGADAQCREVKRIDTSAAFFLSIEFQQTGYFVYRAFAASFGPTRVGSTVPLTLQEFLPDTQRIGRGIIVGQGNWQQQLEANKQAYLLEFVQRPAFTTQYPAAMSEAAFVDALNSNTGNSLTPAQRDALVAQLSANNTPQGRADVLRQVIDNAAFQAREFNRAFVLMQYFGYLRRNPNDPPDTDFSGYNFWLAKLNSFNGDYRAAEMVKAFITSTEYRRRFGPN